MLMAKAVDELAAATPGKKAIAIESFARALRQVYSRSVFYNINSRSCQPSSLTMLVTIVLIWFHNCELPTTKANPRTDQVSSYNFFIFVTVEDMFNNKIADVRELGITEAFKLKRQVLISATEAAEMILRVDNIIRYVHQANTLK